MLKSWGTGKLRTTLAMVGALVLAGCTAAPPPAPPPPPAQVAIPVPFRPVPPLGAMINFPLPPKDFYGARITPNSNLDEEQRVWHFRSAFNVAALNCRQPAHTRLVDDYNLFITNHATSLNQINRGIDTRLRAEYGDEARAMRDVRATQVYNFFALPPLREQLCDTMLPLGQEAALIPTDQLTLFAARALPQVEGIYERFFAAYEQYNADLALWTAVYAPRSVQPTASAAVYRAPATVTTTYGPVAPAPLSSDTNATYGPPSSTSEWTTGLPTTPAEPED